MFGVQKHGANFHCFGAKLHRIFGCNFVKKGAKTDVLGAKIGKTHANHKEFALQNRGEIFTIFFVKIFCTKTRWNFHQNTVKFSPNYGEIFTCFGAPIKCKNRWNFHHCFCTHHMQKQVKISPVFAPFEVQKQVKFSPVFAPVCRRQRWTQSWRRPVWWRSLLVRSLLWMVRRLRRVW